MRHRGEGDSSLSIFARASDAVRAAIEVRQASARRGMGHRTTDSSPHVCTHRRGRSARRRLFRWDGEPGRAPAISRGPERDPVFARYSRPRRRCAAGRGCSHRERRPPTPGSTPAGSRVRHQRRLGHRVGWRKASAFRILGALTVDGEEISSPQEARLLARLLSARNATVSESELLATLWGADAPTTARNSLQSKVSRLRSLVGGAQLEHAGTGYRLRVGARDVDADRFEELVGAALAADSPGTALGHLDEALALWPGGAPYGELRDVDFVRAEATRLEAQRRSAEDLHLQLAADVYSPAEVLAESERVLERDPFRETAWAVRVQLLSELGRRVEALRALHDYRRRLAEETGLTPSAHLLDLERSLLDGETPPAPVRRRESSRTTRPRAAAATRGGIVWSGPLRAQRPIVGRDGELQSLDNALAAAVRGSPAFILITGEAGIGKTRLAEAVASRAAGAGILVLRASGLAAHRGPLGTLRRVAFSRGAGRGAQPRPRPVPNGMTSTGKTAIRPIASGPGTRRRWPMRSRNALGRSRCCSSSTTSSPWTRSV